MIEAMPPTRATITAIDYLLASKSRISVSREDAKYREISHSIIPEK